MQIGWIENKWKKLNEQQQHKSNNNNNKTQRTGIYSFLFCPAFTPPFVRNSGKSVSNLTSACTSSCKFASTITALSYKSKISREKRIIRLERKTLLFCFTQSFHWSYRTHVDPLWRENRLYSFDRYVLCYHTHITIFLIHEEGKIELM